MRWSVVCLLVCAACGFEPNPFTISGEVHLTALSDGGVWTEVLARPYRILPDGGTQWESDAGIALNGVPLGPGAIAAGMPDTLTWAGASLPGAGPQRAQTLSVIGSWPEASATFTCPAQVAFTAPQQGAIVDRSQPVGLSWTPGGSSKVDQVLLFVGGDQFRPLFGFQLIAPGKTSAVVPLSDKLPAAPTPMLFVLSVAGDSPTSDSACTFLAARSIVFE